MIIRIIWWLGLVRYGFLTAQGMKIAISLGATSYSSMMYRYERSNSGR